MFSNLLLSNDSHYEVAGRSVAILKVGGTKCRGIKSRRYEVSQIFCCRD